MKIPNVRWEGNLCMANDALVAWVEEHIKWPGEWFAEAINKDRQVYTIGERYGSAEEAQLGAEVELGIH